jgi:hypothetical protein
MSSRSDQMTKPSFIKGYSNLNDRCAGSKEEGQFSLRHIDIKVARAKQLSSCSILPCLHRYGPFVVPYWSI